MKNKTEELREVPFGQSVISFHLLRKKVKNINLRIRPDGSVMVSAGPRISQKLIDEFVRSKAPWILSALEKYTKENRLFSSPRIFENGEEVSFLGQLYPVLIAKSPKNAVTFAGQSLVLSVQSPDNLSSLQALWDQWQREQCRAVFEETGKKVHPLFIPFGIPYPVMKVRKMKARWGSCRPASREITLNQRLIAAPPECIEYVVLHEFAHLIHPNHAKPFHDLVEHLMPDWKTRKEILRQYE